MTNVISVVKKKKERKKKRNEINKRVAMYFIL